MYSLVSTRIPRRRLRTHEKESASPRVFFLLWFCLRIDHLFPSGERNRAHCCRPTMIYVTFGVRQFQLRRAMFEATLRTPTTKWARRCSRINFEWSEVLWAVKVVKVAATHRRRHRSLFFPICD